MSHFKNRYVLRINNELMELSAKSGCELDRAKQDGLPIEFRLLDAWRSSGSERVGLGVKVTEVSTTLPDEEKEAPCGTEKKQTVIDEVLPQRKSRVRELESCSEWPVASSK